jgi:hypothetical protein
MHTILKGPRQRSAAGRRVIMLAKDKMPSEPVESRPDDFQYGTNYMSRKMVAESHVRVAKSQRLLRRTADLLRRTHPRSPKA